MAFPVSPTDGLTYVNNNVTYVYSAGLGVWNVQGAVSTASPVTSVAGRTGVVTLTAADVAAGTLTGAFTMTGAITVNGIVYAASSTASTSTATGGLVVTGGAGIAGAVYAGSIQNTPIGSTTASTGAFTSLTASSLTVTGGIQGTTIGATTASTGNFTSLTATSFTLNGAATASGNNAITFGPNSSWSAYLKVGGNGIDGTTAQIAATNGNLHLESLGAAYPIYLNYYRSGGVNAYGAFTMSSSLTVATGLSAGTTAVGAAGQILATNSIVAYYSDERLKTKVGKIENALDKIDELSGFLYTENDLAKSLGFNNETVQVALSAQDVHRVQPEATSLAPFDMDDNGGSKSGENYLTVQYERLVPLLVEGIKEIRRELNTIKRQLK